MLDIHPEPAHSALSVLIDGDNVPIGALDETNGIDRIRAARPVLAAAIAGGLFVVEQETTFDFAYYFDGVDEWTSYMAEEWASAVVEPALIQRARTALPAGQGRLVIRERVHAARLRRA